MTVLTRPMVFGARRFPPLGLLILATVGGVLLIVVAAYRWGTPSDEYAYWLAGERLIAGLPLYDPSATPGVPYAYFYPPPLAQVLAPFTAIVPGAIYVAAWTALLLGCLFVLAHHRILVAIAFVAFVPVAIELWYRNIHLVLAVILVLALRKSPVWFAVGAAIKVTPVLGLLYLVAARRWRDAGLVVVVGVVMLAVSVLISPDAWRQFIDIVTTLGPTTGATIIDVPFAARAVVGVGLAVVAGLLAHEGRARDGDSGIWLIRAGESALLLAIVAANPTLWVTAFSLLIAIVPLWRTARTAAA